MTATETVPCPICDEEETRLLFRDADDRFSMGACTDCGLIRQNPRLTADHIREIDYDGQVQNLPDFFGDTVDNEGLEHWQSQPLAAYEKGVAFVDRFWGEKPKGLWLDIGASTGALVVAARNAGWQVGGCELGRGQVELCKRVHGIDIFYGTLDEAGFPDEHADVISYRHVLEHVHAVRDELALARRILKPDGLLLIEVPNYAGVKYTWGRVRTKLHLTKPFWLGLNIPEHIYYFTIRSLTRLLALEKFEVLGWETYGKTRRKRPLMRRLGDKIQHGLRVGNKMRVVARVKPSD